MGKNHNIRSANKALKYDKVAFGDKSKISE
jgi:hypothetical protein